MDIGRQSFLKLIVSRPEMGPEMRIVQIEMIEVKDVVFYPDVPTAVSWQQQAL